MSFKYFVLSEFFSDFFAYFLPLLFLCHTFNEAEIFLTTNFETKTKTSIFVKKYPTTVVLITDLF